LLQLPSPVERIEFDQYKLYLKRDDLIHTEFSGNKARKFQYFLDHDFPNIKKLVSYGSSQSNAMYSMSVLAQMRGWDFEYSVDHLSSYLQENPHGNYSAALSNGMKITRREENNIASHRDDTLYIQEGGRQAEAEYGIAILCSEIWAWYAQSGLEKLDIFLPSGTGTTALFLQKALIDIDDTSSYRPRVYTTPCVGDSSYLTSQFLELEEDARYHPEILTIEKKHHFGKLYRENYEIWLKLRQQTKVEFDLLYDPLGWRVLLAHPELLQSPMLYIHQGGVLGNESMLPRYERKYKQG